MTRQPHLDPSAFFLPGGPVGALLIHGFTGSPPEMRRVGDVLHQRGLTISAPLLPGHGTIVEEMNRARWTDWTAHVEQALAELQARCPIVFVGGLSMGSLLTLYLAGHHPELQGIVLYSPAVWVADRRLVLTPLLKHVIPVLAKGGESDSDLTDPEAHLYLWSYEQQPIVAAHELLKLLRQVRRLQSRITCPTLIIYSTGDQAIHPTSAQRTYEQIGASDKKLLTLRNSGHCITVDSEWQVVAEDTYAFIRSHLPPGIELD